jgi:hypothetical protein
MVDGRSGLELAEVVSGIGRAVLDRSLGFSATSAHFWPATGARVIGVREREIAVWDASTGKRVWSTGA